MTIFFHSISHWLAYNTNSRNIYSTLHEQKAAFLLLLRPKQNQQLNYLKWAIWKSEIRNQK